MRSPPTLPPPQNLKCAPESTIFNFKILNFVRLRSVLVNLENIIFMGVGLPDFREGQVEKQGQNWKNAQFLSVLKGNFYCLSLNGKNSSHFTILTPNAPFDFKTEPENSKSYVFEHIFKHFLNFEPLPPLISGLNPKFDSTTLCVLN